MSVGDNLDTAYAPAWKPMPGFFVFARIVIAPTEISRMDEIATAVGYTSAKWLTAAPAHCASFEGDTVELPRQE